ncbi:MAG: OmpW/AlkL family protein [Gallionella sp.]
MKKQAWMTMTVIAATLCAGAAQAAAGDYLVRGRVISVQPSSSSTPVAGVSVANQTTLEVDVTRFLTDNIALELIAATTKHDVSLNNSKLGTVGVLPPTLTAQYHFMPSATIRPYVGAGLNYTRFYSVNLPTGLDVGKSSFGGALQAGVDFQVNKDFFINLDVKKIFMKTDVTSNGAYATTLTIDPVVIGLGVGMKF